MNTDIEMQYRCFFVGRTKTSLYIYIYIYIYNIIIVKKAAAGSDSPVATIMIIVGKNFSMYP
jgi:hypothetical protein